MFENVCKLTCTVFFLKVIILMFILDRVTIISGQNNWCHFSNETGPFQGTQVNIVHELFIYLIFHQTSSYQNAWCQLKISINNLSKLHQPLQNLAKPCQTLQNLTKPYQALPNLAKPNQTLLNLKKSLKTLQNLTKPYQPLANLNKPYQSLPILSKPYQTVPNLGKVSVRFGKVLARFR